MRNTKNEIKYIHSKYNHSPKIQCFKCLSMKEKMLIIFLGTYCCTLLCTVAQKTNYSSRTILKELIRKLDDAAKGISIAKSYGNYLLKNQNSVIKETSHSKEDGYRLINTATDRNDITMNGQCNMKDPATSRYCSKVGCTVIQISSIIDQIYYSKSAILHFRKRWCNFLF